MWELFRGLNNILFGIHRANKIPHTFCVCHVLQLTGVSSYNATIEVGSGARNSRQQSAIEKLYSGAQHVNNGYAPGAPTSPSGQSTWSRLKKATLRRSSALSMFNNCSTVASRSKFLGVAHSGKNSDNCDSRFKPSNLCTSSRTTALTNTFDILRMLSAASVPSGAHPGLLQFTTVFRTFGFWTEVSAQ